MSQTSKMYLRQEDLMCSQTVDSQCEVRWDCTSPDAIRHLRKIKKCRKGKDNMSDIVLRFLDDHGEVSTNTPPLLSLWMESKKENTKKPVPGQKERKNQSTRRRRRPTGQDENEAKALLQKMIEQCEIIEEPSSTNRTSGEQTCLKGLSEGKNSSVKHKSPKCQSRLKADPGSLSDKGDNAAVNASLKTVTSEKPVEEDKKNLSDDNIWPDDDLFAADSLILEATQLPAGKRKLNSPAREQPNVKNKRYTFSLTADSGGAPAKASVSNTSNSVQNTTLVKKYCNSVYQPTSTISNTTAYNPSLQQKSVCQQNVHTSNISAKVCAANNNSLKKHSSFDDKPSVVRDFYGQSVHSDSKQGKPSWRRSNSFSGLSSPAHRQPTCTVSRPEPVSNRHKNTKVEINNNRLNVTSVGTTYIQDSCQPKISASCISMCEKEERTKPHGDNQCNNNDCLDTSISDELLAQLAEPDELLESQLTPNDSPHKVSDELYEDDLFDDEMDDVIRRKTGSKRTITKSMNAKYSVNYSDSNSDCDRRDYPKSSLHANKVLPKDSGNKLPHTSVASKDNVPLQDSQNRFTFKKTVSKPKSTNASVNDSRSTISDVQSQSGLKSNAQSISNELENHFDLDTNDSFPIDDPLFESQILAFLEQVETQETQNSSQNNKCTSKEIEQKRLAALEKQKVKKQNNI